MNNCCFNFSDTVRLVSAFSFMLFGRVIFDFNRAAFDDRPLCIHQLIEDSVLAADNTYRDRAADIAKAVTARFPELRRILKEDAESIFLNDPAADSVDEIMLCYPGFFATFCYRAAHEIYTEGAHLLARFISEYAHSMTGIDIHPGARIGERFSIDHGTGVVIGESAVIGNGVRIYQGVTVGAKDFPRLSDGSFDRNIKRHPTISDNCVLYANSTVLGGDTVIGEESVITANAIVTSSVPAHTVVIYDKGRKKYER